MAIRIKRVYESPHKADGRRILVDRLWPRGLSHETLRLDEWMKEIAPSDGLRSWFGHRPERWREFQKRYREELNAPERRPLLARLRSASSRGAVTLLFAAKDVDHNNAVVLAAMVHRRKF